MFYSRKWNNMEMREISPRMQRHHYDMNTFFSESYYRRAEKQERV
jgi:hypothetical protein